MVIWLVSHRFQPFMCSLLLNILYNNWQLYCFHGGSCENYVYIWMTLGMSLLSNLSERDLNR